MTDNKNGLEPEKKGVESLAEVLRLQAEALSRISERMAKMNQVTGKPPSPFLGKEQSMNGVHLPALAGDPSLNEDSLPVLNSFKQFLAQERRRGRKRFVWGLCGFTLVFACLLVAIVLFTRARDEALKADIEQTSTKLDRSQKDAESNLKKALDKTAQTTAKSEAVIRSDITRNILWAHSALASNMTTGLSDRNGQIERLKEKVSSLEVDNTMLSRQVAELAQRIQIIETDYLDNIERPLPSGRNSEANNLALPASSAASAEGAASPVMINSARFGRSLQMRVPKE